MITVEGLLAELEARLCPHLTQAEARGEARLLLAHGTGIDRLHQRTAPDQPVAAAVATRILALAERRGTGVPMAYLLGCREFWGLPFAVGPGVLIPRPDSETLVEAALRHLKADVAARVLDLGTGSGCLLLSVLHERPLAWGVGVDRSPEALAYAARNARALGIESRVGFVRGDWWQALSGRFDVVLANPPYVPTASIQELMVEVRGHEPLPALDGGADGLEAYRTLLAGLHLYLAPGGLALFEIGHDQGESSLALARDQGFATARLLQDLAGRNRCLAILSA